MLLFAAVGKAQNFYDFSAVNDGDTIYYNIVDGNAEVASVDSECSGEVSIPSSVTYNGTTYSVTSIGDWAFYNCTNLTSVTIPNGVNSIGYRAFAGCSSLTSITIPSSVMNIGQFPFDECSSLTEINVDPSSKRFSSQDGVLFNYDKTEIVCCPEGKAGTYTIPSSVTSIGLGAFAGCSSLTSITIPDGVTSIGEFAFEYCSSLTSVTIPDNATSIVDGMFMYCRSLSSVAIPNSVTSIGRNAFTDCSSLTSITIPDSVTSIGDYAFDGCSNLTSVIIPSKVTSIDKGLFFGCSSLTSVSIPSSVKYTGTQAFYGCISLTSIIIPSSVTGIGSYAFYGCMGLTSVTIPSSVTSIGSSAFSCCDSLTTVFTYIQDLFEIKENTFGDAYANATLYVPQGTKEAYDTTAYWSNFTNIVEMVPYDVDCDGELNNTDVQAIIEKLLELFTEVFNQTAADVNGDGEIDVVDAVLMAKQILTGDNGSRSLPAMRHAADAGTASLYSENISATIGQQATLPISLTNTADIAGLQFDLVLPEGVTVATNADGELLGEMATRGAKLSLRGNRLDNGTYRFVAMSMEGANVSGSEGEVVNLTLDVASDVVAGEYDVQVSNVRLAVDGNTQTVVADAHTSTLTVAAPSAITAIETNAETKAYNLRGIQVKSPRRGIVIMNGQKVLRK